MKERQRNRKKKEMGRGVKEGNGRRRGGMELQDTRQRGGQRKMGGRLYPRVQQLTSDAYWLKICRQISQSHRWMPPILKNGPEQQWWWR